MQLFYDAMFKNQFNGLPICRPMFINIPNDKALFNDKEKFLSNQFFVGRDLLVAPILWPQIDQGVNNHGKRDIYLPASCGWYCYMNNIMPLGHMVEGGTTVRDFDANINI
jgi:alpha-glucosidase